MHSLPIVIFSVILFVVAYLFYGRWLVKTWGIDEKAITPAHKFEDGEDFVPTSRFSAFAHQFSSITGAGPVTGPIIAAMFGWAPALAWLIVGGIFFGAVQDFATLYASVKNEGKSVGLLIDRYVGKTGRVLFLIFLLAVHVVVAGGVRGHIGSHFRRCYKCQRRDKFAECPSRDNFNALYFCRNGFRLFYSQSPTRRNCKIFRRRRPRYRHVYRWYEISVVSGRYDLALRNFCVLLYRVDIPNVVADGAQRLSHVVFISGNGIQRRRGNYFRQSRSEHARFRRL